MNSAVNDRPYQKVNLFISLWWGLVILPRVKMACYTPETRSVPVDVGITFDYTISTSFFILYSSSRIVSFSLSSRIAPDATDAITDAEKDGKMNGEENIFNGRQRDGWTSSRDETPTANWEKNDGVPIASVDDARRLTRRFSCLGRLVKRRLIFFLLAICSAGQPADIRVS